MYGFYNNIVQFINCKINDYYYSPVYICNIHTISLVSEYN